MDTEVEMDGTKIIEWTKWSLLSKSFKFVVKINLFPIQAEAESDYVSKYDSLPVKALIGWIHH